MASITFAIGDDIKPRLEKFSWVNWSELARESVIHEDKLKDDFEKVKKILSSSRFTEKDAEEMSEKVKQAMRKSLKKEGLL